MDKPHDPEKCISCLLNRLVRARYGSPDATLDQVGELMDDLAYTTASIANAVPSGELIYALMFAKHIQAIRAAPRTDIHADMSVKH